MAPCPYCSKPVDPTGPAVATSYRDGPHGWIPVVEDIHGWSPDFLWHPHCYVRQYGVAELERLIGDDLRWRLRHARKQLGPGS
ncbi:hypothetical protein ACFV6F_35380 [Kitasatospora phosalacinea]|uniref:hypothetical protein n=1 Tax=Kitasatospora phosalacinea TaxID=2065 RepID=UPI00364E785D